jgi:LytS/YehU family sensor histidine kinase
MGSYPFWLSLARGFVNILPLSVLFYANTFLIGRYFDRSKYLSYLVPAVILTAVLALLRVNLNQLFPGIPRQNLILPDRSGLWMVALSTNVLTLLISTFYQIMEIRFQNEQHNMEIIQRHNEAQIQFLRAQINPHFLFNTLNNIYSLAVIGSDRTAAMVLQLSRLLRYVVYDSQAPLIPLEREIAHIRDFLELFQMRSESPLNIRFDVKGSPEGFWIEPMILIPLVENSCKHCDFDLNEHAFIVLDLELRADKLSFQTRNSRTLYDTQKDQAGGVGLGNIQKRLELKYPGTHTFQIEAQPTCFNVTLTLIPT